MEMFYSIQGEGFHTGAPAFFIRLGGCDVGCHWCDVKESWEVENHSVKSINEIISEAESSGAKTIIVTGGEPLMYDLSSLTEKGRNKKFNLHLETSGAYPLTGEWDWICLSPKKNKEPLSEIYQHANELKVIVYNKDDFRFAEVAAKQFISTAPLLRFSVSVAESESGRTGESVRPLFLQPEWNRREAMLPLIVDYVKENPHWRISIQTLKYIGV
ncbi:MAG: 7-carboxy-7-deazaguanine synthase QueE, partial [Bacteroidota bacterium]